MRKRIKQPATTQRKVFIICSLFDKQLSNNEINILSELVEMSQGNSITLNVQITKQIRETLDISESSLNTSIHRLEQKKVITKSGKTIVLSPIFNDLLSLEGLVIEFIAS